MTDKTQKADDESAQSVSRSSAVPLFTRRNRESGATECCESEISDSTTTTGLTAARIRRFLRERAITSHKKLFNSKSTIIYEIINAKDFYWSIYPFAGVFSSIAHILGMSDRSEVPTDLRERLNNAQRIKRTRRSGYITEALHNRDLGKSCPTCAEQMRLTEVFYEENSDGDATEIAHQYGCLSSSEHKEDHFWILECDNPEKLYFEGIERPIGDV